MKEGRKEDKPTDRLTDSIGQWIPSGFSLPFPNILSRQLCTATATPQDLFSADSSHFPPNRTVTSASVQDSSRHTQSPTVLPLQLSPNRDCFPQVLTWEQNKATSSFPHQMRQGIQELTQTKSSRLSVFVIVLTYKVTVDPELVTPATPLLGKTVFMHAGM